jgi:hypothetical protein
MRFSVEECHGLTPAMYDFLEGQLAALRRTDGAAA